MVEFHELFMNYYLYFDYTFLFYFLFVLISKIIKMNKLIKIIYLFLFFNFILSTQIFNKENGSECSSNLECKHACCKKKKCVKNDDCKNYKYILYYFDIVLF